VIVTTESPRTIEVDEVFAIDIEALVEEIKTAVPTFTATDTASFS